jgi:hypothetical protein
MINERYYHAARAAEERRIAMASVDLKVRAIHVELADRYDALVKGNPGAEVPVAEDLLKLG